MSEEPWLKRHRPRRNLAELGLGLGVLLPGATHELYDYTKTWQPYHRAAAAVTLRAGFYPLSFLGVEADVGVAPVRTEGGDWATLFGVRAHVVGQLPLYSVAPFVLVGGGVMGSAGALGRDIDPSLHFGGGVKVFLNRWLGARVDGRAHVGPAHTIAADRTFYPEIVASVIFTLGRPYTDTDRDGLPDPGQRARVEDACPREPGVKALRGCPDFDSDGIRDGDDRCPTQPGLAPRDGCPALIDTDNDGYYDPGQYKITAGREDRCPDAIGVAEYGGCEIPDSDGDSHDDMQDRCKDKAETVNGFEDSDGCPDKIPLDVTRLLGTIDGLQFAFLSAHLTETSKPILQRVAAILAEYPEIKFEIQGHTDRDGDPAANKDLSLRRAEAVRSALVASGVAADRVKVVGYGSERPLDEGDSDTSRTVNRRIEFRLLDAEGNALAVPDDPKGNQ